MIQCETCQKWQHGQCIGYKTPDDVPDSYACEQCRPDLYEDVDVKKEGEKGSPARRKRQKTYKERGKEKVQLAFEESANFEDGKEERESCV
jgi:hypothetical protein